MTGSSFTVNPKTAMALNIALAIVSALAGAGAMFTDVFGADLAKIIVASCGLAGLVLGAINTALHALSTRTEGPVAKYLEGD